MNSLLNSLQIRYNSALQSSSESEFYQNVHGYIDFIVKTPALAKIIKTAEDDYRKKHGDIWFPKSEDQKENDLRSERTTKMERFNLYAAHYTTLLVRIYYPLEDYITTDELNADQDPVALVMLKGLKNVLRRRYDKDDPKHHFKWDRDRLKSYARHYEGMRKYYEDELRKFNLQLINAVELTNILEKPKIEIKDIKYPVKFISEKSILYIGNKNVSISERNQLTIGHYILEHLFSDTKDRPFFSEIAEDKLGEKDEKYKWYKYHNACMRLQEKIRKTTGIEDFLIFSSGETGSVQINPRYL